MSAIDHEPFPRGALIAAGGLVAMSLVAAAYGRYQNVNQPADAARVMPMPAQELNLFFADEANGTVLVRNADTGQLILTIRSGEDAFIRAVMRGFVRDRKARKIGSETPFKLSRFDNGRLIVSDPTIGKEINLNAFGPTNEAAFARLFQAPKSP
jgi:putative photosynthetic complex assembly protein